MLIPETLTIDRSKGAVRLDATAPPGSKVHFVPIPCETLQVVPYPDHLLLVALGPVDTSIVAYCENSPEPAAICRVTTTEAPAPKPLPAKPWKWPTMALVNQVASVLLLVAMLGGISVAGVRGCKGTGPVDPIPTPVDPVKPDPAPIAKAAKVAAVIVEDTSKRTPAEGKVIMDPQVRGKLAAEGHRVIEFSIADPSYKTHGYESYVRQIGLPAVIVFDAAKSGQTSAPLTFFRLPGTAAEFDSKIRQAVK